MNFGRQRFQLAWRLIVARKQDHATSERMVQSFAVGIVETLSFDVEHYHAQRRSTCRHVTAPVRPLRMPFLFRGTNRGDDASHRGLRDIPAMAREIRTPA